MSMQRRRRPDRKAPIAPVILTKPLDDRWFRTVADSTYDWESWHGPDGLLVWVNSAVQRITGYSVEACLAMPDYPLPMIAQEDRGRVADILARAHSQVSGEGTEFRCIDRRGESRWMSLAWQQMHEDQGSYLGFRTSVRDVTERRNLREQLRLHANHLEQLVQERTARLRQLEQRQRQMEKLAALGQLAAGVAHEINNPLAGIRNAFELIKSDLGPEHEHFNLLVLIDGEIERISGIVHQMYQLYRRSPQSASEFALDRIAQDVVFLLQHAARKREVVLTCVPSATPANVVLPEGEVKQILYNLVRNAVEASPARDEVKVSINTDTHEAAVRVKNNGSGIPSDVLSQIFDPFFSTKQGKRQSGMGLGLSVSRSLAEAMGGRIEVVTGPAAGALFSAVFPRRLEVGEARVHE